MPHSFTAHAPSIRCSDTVEIIAGPYAGLCGVVVELSLSAKDSASRVVVKLQDGRKVETNRADVEKV